MKILFFFSLLSLNSYAQYLNVELSNSDLDPKPLVKDMGDPPKPIETVSIDESKRSEKENIGRSPAVIKEVEEDKAISK